jgi:hypothetical protein
MAAAGKWNSKNTTVTIADSTGVYSMTVGPGEGNLTISGIMEDNSEAIQTMDRGIHDGLIEGADVTQEVSVSVMLRELALTNAGGQTAILDAIRKTGAWSSATTCDPAGIVWAPKITVSMSRGGTTASIVLPAVRVTAEFAESMEGHTLSISGTNYVAPTYA